MILKQRILSFARMFLLQCTLTRISALLALLLKVTGSLNNRGHHLCRYPWDVYLAVEYDSAEISGIEESTPWATLAARLLRREMTHWGTSAVQIGDAGVVAALIAMVSGDSTLFFASLIALSMQRTCAPFLSQIG